MDCKLIPYDIYEKYLKPMKEVEDCKDVVELALCESDKLVLKPDQLYIFRAHPDCKECLEMQAEYHL